MADPVPNIVHQPDFVEEFEEGSEEEQPVPNILNDDCLLAIRHPRRDIWPPGEWWLSHRKPATVISDSDSDEEDDDIEQVNVMGNNQPEPTSYKEAIESEHMQKWNEAMSEEYNWHLENGT